MDVVEEKKAARKAVRQRLREVDKQSQQQQSAQLCSRIAALDVFKQARTVVAYLTCSKLREVDTHLLVTSALARNVDLYVPVVQDSNSNMKMLHLDSLDGLNEVPPFGILEPRICYKNGSLRRDIVRDGITPDVILLPGLAFDRAGNRLGRGGGYYDKFLASVMTQADLAGKPQPVLVGLCFREQILRDVPMDRHDQRCHWLVTPDEVISCQ